MERQDYMEMIASLRESNGRFSDLRDTVRSLNEAMALRDKQISDLFSQVARLTASLDYANDKLAVRNKERYDRISQSNRYQKGKKVTRKSREEDKEEHDVSADNGNSSSVESSVDRAFLLV